MTDTENTAAHANELRRNRLSLLRWYTWVVSTIGGIFALAAIGFGIAVTTSAASQGQNVITCGALALMCAVSVIIMNYNMRKELSLTPLTTKSN